MWDNFATFKSHPLLHQPLSHPRLPRVSAVRLTVPFYFVYFNMSEGKEDADMAPSIAAGYKISEKKTLNEYTALDAKYIHLIPVLL